MTNKQLDNRVKKLQALEAQMKELEDQAEAIRAELKADLESKGEDEHNTGSFIIRWKEIINRRLDSKALKCSPPIPVRAFPGASPSHEKGPLSERRPKQQTRDHTNHRAGAGNSIIAGPQGKYKGET